MSETGRLGTPNGEKKISDMQPKARPKLRPSVRPSVQPSVQPMVASEDKRISRYQTAFLALTLVVIIIIILITRDLAVSLLIIGLLTNYLVISAQLTLMKQRHISSIVEKEMAEDAEDGDVADRLYEENFANDGAPDVPDSEEVDATSEVYPGSIDVDTMELSDPRFWYSGHDEKKLGAPPPVGNPFILNNMGDCPADGPCSYVGSAENVFDLDEKMALLARSKNDLSRATTGAHRESNLLNRYLKEELDTSENSVWWTRDEF